MALLGDSKQAAWQRQTNRVTDRAHTAETHTYCNSPLPSRTIQPVNDAEDQRRLHISQKHTALKYPSAEVNEISRISPLELRQPCLSLRGERRERERRAVIPLQAGMELMELLLLLLIHAHAHFQAISNGHYRFVVCSFVFVISAME